jgi:EmrB/QacA subfamily drug resistance transporter
MGEQIRSRRYYTGVLLTASGGTFLAMLDSTIINLAIPSLHRNFPASSIPTLSLVITAYVVLFAALLAPAGRLSDVCGRRLLFISGVAVFALMSLASALAPSLPLLVAARALQGAGAAAMLPAALAILLIDGPPGKGATSIGIWSACSAMAAVLGPSISGILVNSFGWRAVFYINLPFSVAMLISAARLLPRHEAKAVRGRIPDPFGTILLTVGIAALTLGVTEGVTWHWDGARTLACLVGGAAVLALALLRASHARIPAIDIGLWRNRTFVTTNVVSLLYGMAQYPWMLVGVLYITSVWRYSELEAGLAMSPGAFVAAAAALALGRHTGRRGPRIPILGGLAVMVGCGFWLVFGLTHHPAFLTLWLPAGFVGGFGMGATTMGTSSAAVLSAPRERFAGASGMNTTARQFGGALGIAIAAVTLSVARPGVHTYERVYLYCTIFSLVAMIISAIWLRFAGWRPEAAAAPVSTPAVVAAGAAQPAPGTAQPAE